jgi:hypothetical protein
MMAMKSGNQSLDRRDLDRRLDEWAESYSGDSITDGARQRIMKQLSGEPASLTPVQPLPSQGILVLRLFAIFVVLSIALTAALYGIGAHLIIGWPMNLMVALFAFGGVAFSLLMAAEMAPGTSVPMGFPVVLAALAVMMAVGFAVAFRWQSSSAFALEGRACALLEAGFTAIAAPAVWGFARRGALFSSARLGAILLGLSVCVALIPLQLQCMSQQAPHLLIWHGGTAALLVLAGAAVVAFRARNA